MELSDYQQYVEENNFTTAGKSKYYVGWVKKYLGLNLSNQLSNQEKIKQFREYMDVDQSRTLWVVSPLLTF